MVKYIDIVKHVKENNINWNTDVFDILKDYFSQYSWPPIPSDPLIQQELVFPNGEFQEPADSEYTIEDVLKLFST